MLKNYLKITLRNLLKFKGYTALNTLGLAVGIAASLLIIQHVRDELSVDQHHTDAGRLYRIGTTFNLGDETTITAMSPSPLAWTLVQDYPEVESAARLLNAPGIPQYLIKYGEQAFFEQKGYLVDSTFFRLLTFDFTAGKPAHALDEPNTVVLTRPLAEKLFGSGSPIGQTIKIIDPNGEYACNVTGVIDPGTEKSHIDGNFYMNMRSTASGQHFNTLTEWAGNNLFYTYIRLQPGADPKALEAKFPALVEAKAGERLRTLGFQKKHFLEPVPDIYLKSEATYQIGPVGNMTFVYIFSAIAAFILLIACINFMNLATAKATLRAREVGVRKVVGASRRMLIQQFMSESLIHSVAAVLIACLGAKIALPYFNTIAGKELSINFMHDSTLMLWVGGIAMSTALLAGSYPALYLSGFTPVSIFRGKTGDRFSAQQVRKGLVVVQFIVSIALVQGILVIQQQLNYVRHKNLGFEKDARLVVQMNTAKSLENYHALKQEVRQQAGVLSLGGSSAVPGSPNVEDMLFYAEGKSPDETAHAFRQVVDPSYMSTMKFNLLAGRFFDENRSADSIGAVVITEHLMHDLGYSLDHAVGRKFYWNWQGIQHTQEIIGVVRDFHAVSLRSELDGQIFYWNHDETPKYLVVSGSTTDLPALVSNIRSTWQRINPGEPFEFFFLDEKLQQAYLSDQQTARLIFAFTLLALFISCLGLFGLAAFAAESRTKEIGVRKVLGASIGNIIALLSRDFVRLVLLALVIATPIAWYFMQKWLEDFHYHVNMPWWAFLLAGVVATGITLLTVSWQSVRAAAMNPVKSLRSD